MMLRRFRRGSQAAQAMRQPDTGRCKTCPVSAEPIEIRRLGATEVRAQLDPLAAVLADCVAGGASVSYMAPFSYEQARGVFEAWAV